MIRGRAFAFAAMAAAMMCMGGSTLPIPVLDLPRRKHDEPDESERDLPAPAPEPAQHAKPHFEDAPVERRRVATVREYDPRPVVNRSREERRRARQIARQRAKTKE